MNKERYVQLNIFILKICSMYPHKANATDFEKLANRAYRFITMFSLYFTMIPPFYEIYVRDKPGLTSYALDIVNACIYTCTILTAHFYHIQGKATRDLISEMNNLFKWKSTGLADKDMSEITKLTRNTTIAFTSLIFVSVIINSFISQIQNPGERVLPITGRYPFNVRESPYYEISFLIQMHAQLVMSAVTVAGDSFLACMLLTAAAQFEVLANDFSNYMYNALLKHGISKESIQQLIEFSEDLKESSAIKQSFRKRITSRAEINKKNIEATNNSIVDMIKSEGFTVELNKLIIECIKHHQKLFEYCVKMERFFWPFVFMKTIVNLFYNVFIPFAVVTSVKDMTLALCLAQYEACALTELLVYSIAGQAILSKSEELQGKLYFSPWYICNKQHMTLVLMVLMRSGRAVRVSVGKLYIMSHGTFVMILKAAMSYLAVLRQIVD